MNYQEVFDTIVTHLYTQNEVAVTHTGSCALRTEDGLTCAIGCLIHKDHYDEDLEDNSPTAFAVMEAVKASGIEQPDSIFLSQLQSIHDKAFTDTGGLPDPFTSLWEGELQAFARERERWKHSWGPLIYNDPRDYA
jgi:hypothetical protein